MSTSSEQLDIVFHDAVTEQDEAVGSEHSELERQIPSAIPVREPGKEQAETKIEPSVRDNNAILGKTIASHQKDWDNCLSFAMSAYRASQHESTGYTSTMLTLGTEVRAPADIMYGWLNEPSRKNLR